MISPAKTLIYALGTFLSLSAVAQTRYCIGGDLDNLTAGEKASCLATKEMVKATATQLKAPQDWHFVVVCGEEGWRQYTATAERGEVALQDAAADTDLAQRVTFLRQARLGNSQGHGSQRMIAREIASIELNSHDEQAIEAQVAAWDGLLQGNKSGASTGKAPVAEAGI